MDKELQGVMTVVNQMITAATPYVKAAYDMGLTTLRIDAAGSLLIGLVLLVPPVIWLWFRGRLWNNMFDASRRDTQELAGIGFIVGGIVSALATFFALLQLLDVWVWTKLLAPELWLVHMAVEKLVK